MFAVFVRAALEGFIEAGVRALGTLLDYEIFV
jgi:hypothetical protein